MKKNLVFCLLQVLWQNFKKLNHYLATAYGKKSALSVRHGWSPDNTVNYTHFKVKIRKRKSGCEGRMHVSCLSVWLPAPLWEGKRRESMHDRLKIASVESAIFSRSGSGDCMLLLELAWACNDKTDWWMKECGWRCKRGDKVCWKREWYCTGI